MRVLWFANTSAGYKQNAPSHHYYGAGWISSLEQLIAPEPGIELAVCFFHPTDKEKSLQGNTTYYPMLKKKGSFLKKLYNNWTVKMESEKDLLKMLQVIEDFKPDIIQIFGTEGSFTEVQGRTNIPVVIHIQGIINPYLNAWYPPGINGRDIFFKGSNLMEIAKANGYFFARKNFIRRGIREEENFQHTKYVMGRTEWDKNLSELLTPGANYYHVNEVLRPIFYDGHLWEAKNRSVVKIFSNMSPSVYKGLDQVLKTAAILKNISKINFEWFISGISASDSLVKLMEKKFKLKFSENNISFLGTIPADKLIEKLLDADVYVHPSYIENSPNSIGEAQILGIPVIACYVGGITSIIENNKSGILVPANDPYTMASKINMLITNKDTAAEISLNASISAKERHNSKKIVAAIIQVYKSIFDKGQSLN